MSISPRPKQKWGKIKNTFFKTLLIWFRFCKDKNHKQITKKKSARDCLATTVAHFCNISVFKWKTSSFFVLFVMFVLWLMNEQTLLPYVIYKQLQNKGGHAAVDADEEVDGGENHVSCARNGEHKGCWVHQRSYRPPKIKNLIHYQKRKVPSKMFFFGIQEWCRKKRTFCKSNMSWWN